MAREQWGTRAGFILAAVGSAIGLGNIWRFPYVAWENGGGAFFVPYLFALLTAGIPVLALEYTIGHRYQGSAPLSFRRLHKGAEWIGWWQIAVSFVIASYYSVIIAWAAAYTWFAVRLQWGDDPEAFFFEDYLAAGDPGTLGAFRPGVVVPLVALWLVALVIVGGGVRRGIELANRIFIPLLVVIFLILVGRAITLPGAVDGLSTLFTPDWGQITNGQVWIAAYGQIFFTLSIGFAIMITYSSYLPRRSDLTNNAFIAGFSNASFELLAGIGVFAAVGFLAFTAEIEVDEAVADGIGLAFVGFPEIISSMPAFEGLFGVLFFGSLVLAGMSSLISIVETYVAGLREKFGVSRPSAVLMGGGLTAVVSLAYATEGGINYLDVADHFINNFGIAVVGFIEIVAIAWVLRHLSTLQEHANPISDIALGAWWKIALALITPPVLAYMTFDNVRTLLAEGYEDYPTWFLGVFGWGVAAAALVVGVLLSLKSWDPEVLYADGPDARHAPATPPPGTES
jgi:neurotransmitter:Na+ symporter, NSS family